MQILKNTDKSFPCTNCGSENVSIVREDSQNPRLKCNNCNFLFDGADSVAAKESGGLKGSSQEDLAAAQDPETYELESRDEIGPVERQVQKILAPIYSPAPVSKLPRSPAFIFMSKDRTFSQVVSEKDFKKTVLAWEQVGRYDCYQLSAKQVGVKVEIDG